MMSEKSYDNLPNFTAADVTRLIGIGRNEFIDIMNKCRSRSLFFLKKTVSSVKDYLPQQPIDINIDPWWVVHVGFVSEDDVQMKWR